jgi:hypothetical protein
VINFQNPDITATTWCQELIPGSSTLVTIFTGGGGCLAYNASANTFYTHAPTGCGTGAAQYLVWRFISLQNIGSGVYELQNQYDPSGRPCIVARVQAAAVGGNCANSANQPQQFNYISK